MNKAQLRSISTRESESQALGSRPRVTGYVRAAAQTMAIHRRFLFALARLAEGKTRKIASAPKAARMTRLKSAMYMKRSASRAIHRNGVIAYSRPCIGENEPIE